MKHETLNFITEKVGNYFCHVFSYDNMFSDDYYSTGELVFMWIVFGGGLITISYLFVYAFWLFMWRCFF